MVALKDNEDKNSFDTLVWLQTGFLGDIVITTAAFRFVREHCPDVKQIIITTPIGAAALKDHPDLDGLLVFDKRNKSLFSEAKRLKIELSAMDLGRVWMLQTHRSFRSSFLCRLIGLPTITYFESQGGFLADKRVHRVAVLHEAQRILLLLEALGAERSWFSKALPFLSPVRRSEVLETLKKFAGSRPLIALAPGSVWGTKRWPSEHYGELSRLILQRSEAAIVIIGSKDEILAADVVEKAAGDSLRVLNLAGLTNLDDLRAIFPEFRLLVSNDSSPLHYASAFRTPTLAIFGATVPALGFGPLSPRKFVAEVELSCRPCGAHGPMNCPLGHFRCMKDQLPEQVMGQLINHFGDLLRIP
ncbi:MAG: glycosyltransferase family 9 protein [Proteobacteria bacterium]|nr:MAG: glycosyltransferase family 9 protein [Pseudomonadota bacterium]